MDKWELRKTFRFEAAHRLGKGYPGKCKNLHGHSWQGELALEVGQLDEKDFGVDFSAIKEFTKEIEQRLDHAIILNSDDGELIDLCKKHNWTLLTLPNQNPTCEVIAKWIYENAIPHFQKHFGSRVRVSWVEIKETCTSACRYGKSSAERSGSVK